MGSAGKTPRIFGYRVKIEKEIERKQTLYHHITRIKMEAGETAQHRRVCIAFAEKFCPLHTGHAVHSCWCSTYSRRSNAFWSLLMPQSCARTHTQWEHTFKWVCYVSILYIKFGKFPNAVFALKKATRSTESDPHSFKKSRDFILTLLLLSTQKRI